MSVGIICGFERQTGQGTLLARGPQATDSLEEPGWGPDGQALFMTLRQPVLDAQGQYTSERIWVARYDRPTERLEPLIENGMTPAVAPDGKHLVYIIYDPQSGAPLLMQAQVDGREQTPLVPASQGMLSIFSPLWSPDGRLVAFSGARDQALAPPVQPTPQALLEALFAVPNASAHGIPATVWTVEATGQNLRQRTTQGMDDPRLAWSPDSQQLAYVSSTGGGIALIELATDTIQPWAPRGDYGGITWRQP
jgi:Tol biopolymer transport system component